MRHDRAAPLSTGVWNRGKAAYKTTITQHGLHAAQEVNWRQSYNYVPSVHTRIREDKSRLQHSEFNLSPSELVHFLQIWIVPESYGITLSYEQKASTDDEKRGQLRLVASRNGRDGSLTIHQDTDLYDSLLYSGEQLIHPIATGRIAYVHLVRGAIRVNGRHLTTADAAKIKSEQELVIAADEDSELLLFDMA